MEKIWFDQMTFDNGLLYGIDVEEQVIYSVDPFNNIATCITVFPEASAGIFREYVSCVKKDDSLYLFPDKGNAIWKYNIFDNTFFKIYDFSSEDGRKTIRTAFLRGGAIYAISGAKKKIYEIKDDEEVISWSYADSSKLCTEIGSGSCVYDNNIYFTAPEDNMLIIFDTNTKKYRTKQLEEAFFPQTVKYIDGELYLTGRRNYLLILDSNLDVKDRIWIGDGISILKYDDKEYGVERVKEKNRPFFRDTIDGGGKLFLVPYIATELFVYDFIKHKIEVVSIEYENLEQKLINDNEGITYRTSRNIEDKLIWLYRSIDDCIIKCFLNNNKTEISHISKNHGKSYLKSLKNKGIITEGMASLNEFISEVI